MPHSGQRGRRRGGARSFWGGLARVAGDYIADNLPFYHHNGGANNQQRQHHPQGGGGGYPHYQPVGGAMPNYAPPSVLTGGGGGGSGAGQAPSAFEHARPDWKFEREDEDSEEDKQEGEELAALHDGDDDDDVGGSDGANQEYQPARIKGGMPHPGHVVQSVAMAAAEPPPITYKLRLPRRLLDSGALSLLQAEAVLYCMQMHETRLPTGERAGWMLGDGTGIGKGRILASIMLENSLHGRDRAIWVTASPFLATQIRRDARDVGLNTRIFELSDQKLSQNPDLSGMGPGLMICTYRTLLGKESGGPVTRIGQLLSWVGGEGWDGVLALDEAHKAKNLVQQKKRWMATPSSKTAVVVDALQKRLREARVIYASATIATNAGNMESLSRLGLWGPGTAFQTSGKFAVAMHNAGLPGLELLSTNMKLQGKYLARTLGFKACDFEVVRAPMDPEFAVVYDACARQWDELRKDLKLLVPSAAAAFSRRKTNKKRKTRGEAKEESYALKTDGMEVGGEEHEEQEEEEDNDDLLPTPEQKAKAILWLTFWGTHQRFFRSLYVAAKIPTVIKLAREAIEQGYAPVIGLQTTGESQIKTRMSAAAERRRRGRARGEEEIVEEEGGAEGLSMCRGQMERFLTVHLTDALGPGVRAIRARHLTWLDEFGSRLPANPLDQLIEGLGGSKVVAELTGRQLRMKNGKYEQTPTSQKAHEAERTAFQRGLKQVAVISEAASTGISLHSDRREPTAHKRRCHFCLELAWGADRVMQQLGRTHRTNALTGPLYKFVVTEQVGGDTRFISTVARRLQSLGAICQGHEGAVNKALDLREYNVESKHGQAAFAKLWEVENPSPLFRRAVGVMGGSDLDRDSEIKKFLNRCLAFELEVQHVLMDKFFELFNKEVYQAKLEGTYESQGIINIRGEAVQVSGPIIKYRTPTPSPPQAVAPAPAAAAATAAAARAASRVAVGPIQVLSDDDDYDDGEVNGGDEVVNAKAEGRKQQQGQRQQQQQQQPPPREEPTLSLVALALDRGLPFDTALQMLLLAEGGGEGRWGGNGFYLPRDSNRPYLAFDRGGGRRFKTIYPDLGRQAFVDKVPEELARDEFLTPAKAQEPWTRRYEEALTTCLPHGREGCDCNVGKRLHRTYMLVFDVCTHWSFVQKVVSRKRLRVVRAATTSEPRKHFTGVMLTEKAKRRLEAQGLQMIGEGEGESAMVEDARIDVVDLLEEEGKGGRGRWQRGGEENKGVKEEADMGVEDKTICVVEGEKKGGKGGRWEKEEREGREEEEESIIDLLSDLDEIDEEEWEDDRKGWNGSIKSGKGLGEGGGGGEGRGGGRITTKTARTNKPRRRKISQDDGSEEEKGKGGMKEEVMEKGETNVKIQPSWGCKEMISIDDSDEEEEEEKEEAKDGRGGGWSECVQRVGNSHANGQKGGDETGEEAGGGTTVKQEGGGEGGGGEGEEEGDLVLDMLDMLEELKDEDIITKKEAKELRSRAVKKETLVVEAFLKAQACTSLFIGGQMFRKIALGI